MMKMNFWVLILRSFKCLPAFSKQIRVFSQFYKFLCVLFLQRYFINVSVVKSLEQILA